MTKYVEMKLTLEQAKVVQDALDFYTRIGIAQIEEVVPVLQRQFGFDKKANCQVECLPYHEAIPWDLIREYINAIKSLLGFSSNASYGIGNGSVNVAVHRSYEVFKVLSKALIEDRDPNPKFRGVHYDGLTLRYTLDKEPEVTIVDEGEKK